MTTDVRSNKAGFFRRLLRDRSANTLAIGAAAIIPLAGVIGGGLDMSRSYLIKTRLQQACDASTLAARKELSNGTVAAGNIPANVQNAADNFFNANFKSGMYGSQNDTFTLTAGTETRMDGVATAEVPMALMQIFGFDQIDLTVNCSAELNLPNIDVVLVLDQSGSMNNSRMSALRQAVFAFYDEVHAVKPAGSRIRIGVVPYSGAVRVGQVLFEENPDFLADSWTYQTRVAEFGPKQNWTSTDGQTPYSSNYEALTRESSRLGSSNRDDYRWKTDDSSDHERCDAYDGGGRDYVVGDELWRISDDDYYGNVFGDGSKNWRAACAGTVRKFRRPQEFKRYRHQPIENIDTSSFKTFNPVARPVGFEGGNVSSTWNGCIEERQTVATVNFDPIPDDALDLDIHLVPDPSDPATQWKPMWPQITYDRPGPNQWTTTQNRSTRGFNCPSPARRLAEYPLEGAGRNQNFQNYINSLTPTGGTMHDIGMIWAGRFISDKGIFAADNETAPNGDAISRHIIFMTDGEMGAGPNNTTSYGNYDMDGRFAGFAADGTWEESDLAVIHNRRLAAICRRIKNDNITVWSVTFGLPQNEFTRGCATGEQRAFEANNSSALTSAFRRIATAIAELRLVQ